MLFVTGGAGFIGSNFVIQSVEEKKIPVVNLDKLSYAGNLDNLAGLTGNPLHTFVQGDILDRELVAHLLKKHQPEAIVHFAAETHVDRSIDDPAPFVTVNVLGTLALLDEALRYWKTLSKEKRERFRFLYVSTDEVYGSLGADDLPCSEGSPYAPNSPYAASKAGADHLVRAYNRTYDLPTLTSYASNNFGPYQFPEKLIPLTITNALKGKHLPLYGDGLHVRDWIYVKEHCRALSLILAKGVPGQCYNVGGQNEKSNQEIVKMICYILDALRKDSPYIPHSSLIKFVKERPGHDRRYALNSSKMKNQLGWAPTNDFEQDLTQTVVWYLENQGWLDRAMNGEYRQWIGAHYGEEKDL